MRIEVHHYFHVDSASDAEVIVNYLEALNRKADQIMASQQEAAAQLKQVSDTLDKVAAESGRLMVEIEKLREEVAKAPVNPELQEAIDRVAQRAASIDDMVPDTE